MRTTHALALVASVSCLAGAGRPAPDVPDARIRVREGFELSVVARLDGPARLMAVAPDGTLYVTSPGIGVVFSLQDRDRDGSREYVRRFVENRPTVHGITFHDGWVWVTQTGAIFKARDDDHDGVADRTETVIAEGSLPHDGGHWWRSIGIHGGRLYTSIGDPANASDQTDTEREKIWSFDLGGRDKQLFCSGIRNTEKLVFRPGTDELWGMDHGSDSFGRSLGESRGHQPVTDLNPPDEMNHYVQGGSYGHPFIVGTGVPRYEYADRKDIIELAEKTISPEWKTGAHWAPNAMCFYDPPKAEGERASNARRPSTTATRSSRSTGRGTGRRRRGIRWRGCCSTRGTRTGSCRSWSF
ncbi:MAG: PQQ-dependent sugar dehydrogenase [Phycisphaerales bacterium]